MSVKSVSPLYMYIVDPEIIAFLKGPPQVELAVVKNSPPWGRYIPFTL
jgi:hypothetical protein